jgi:tetratricopeptide (TPR) repeat protein
VNRCLAGLIMLCLAGCGGSADTTAKPDDETLQREANAGQLAMQLERPEEAVARYQEALTRAQARDDLAAIGDLGYNLAVAELDSDHPGRALQVARSTEQELRRRGTTAFPALLLVEATALYRTGDLAAADKLARQAAAGSDKQAAARATFLSGLIADDRGDEAGLAGAADALSNATDPSLQADAAELAARMALSRGDQAGARRAAERAVTLRQQTLDYRGLARALALDGEAAKRAGDAKAASDLYLRAGRSAAAQGDATSARRWLKEAASLATEESVRSAATELLGELGSS